MVWSQLAKFVYSSMKWQRKQHKACTHKTNIIYHNYTFGASNVWQWFNILVLCSVLVLGDAYLEHMGIGCIWRTRTTQFWLYGCLYTSKCCDSSFNLSDKSLAEFHFQYPVNVAPVWWINTRSWSQSVDLPIPFSPQLIIEYRSLEG